jgi:outer membrane protein W
MVWRRLGLVVVAAMASGHAWAQEPRAEISGSAGWTLSDGVSSNGIVAADGNLYNRLDPKDSFSYGFGLGFLLSPHWELEFLWNRQSSKLEVGGTSTLEIGDLDVDNYHGVVSYNFGDSRAYTRPYIGVGAGATHYGAVGFTGFDGGSREIGGQTKFSPTFAAGLKLFAGGSTGLRLGVRWTPTYIKTDATGFWCDPYFGCYVVGDSQYSNQFEFSGGLIIRF